MWPFSLLWRQNLDIIAKVKVSHVRLFATLWTLQSMKFPGQNTGAGSHSLLQGIFPNQGLNPGLLHCRQILYQLCHQGSPRTLEWVVYPFSSRASQPRNRTWSPAPQSDSLPTKWPGKLRHHCDLGPNSGWSFSFLSWNYKSKYIHIHTSFDNCGN